MIDVDLSDDLQSAENETVRGSGNQPGNLPVVVGRVCCVASKGVQHNIERGVWVWVYVGHIDRTMHPIVLAEVIKIFCRHPETRWLGQEQKAIAIKLIVQATEGLFW